MFLIQISISFSFVVPVFFGMKFKISTKIKVHDIQNFARCKVKEFESGGVFACRARVCSQWNMQLHWFYGHKGLVTSSDTYFIRKQILKYLDDYTERSGFVKFQGYSQCYLALVSSMRLVLSPFLIFTLLTPSLYPHINTNVVIRPGSVEIIGFCSKVWVA